MAHRRRRCWLSLTHRRHIVSGGHWTHGGHIMTCRRSRSGLSRAHRRHIVSGVHRTHDGHIMTGRSRLCGLSLAHRRHVVACVGVDRDGRRLLRHGAGWTHRRARRPDKGRIRRRRTAAHTTGRKNGCSLRGRGRRPVARMTLRQDSAGRGGQEQWDEADGSADHDEAPSIGRTVTTLNMPACMCINM